jgi:LMBR1-like membrane protein
MVMGMREQHTTLAGCAAALTLQLAQGEDRDAAWVLYVLSFYFSLAGGILFVIVALTWVVHMVVYVIVDPPLHPFLNSFFSALDDAFRLFGVAAFAIWCFFLILAAIKGFTKLGLNFGLIQLYPMKVRLCPHSLCTARMCGPRAALPWGGQCGSAVQALQSGMAWLSEEHAWQSLCHAGSEQQGARRAPAAQMR